MSNVTDPGAVAPGGAFLAPCQPAQRYLLLDVGGYTDVPLPHGRNLVAALVRLERSRNREDIAPSRARWPGPG